MDDRPIGIFDSGLGGLTAVKKLTELLPNEEIVYFGDTGRVPYGGRSRDTIIKYARQDIAFLHGFGTKAILSACGTVSTTALDAVKGEYPEPLFGVAEPAVRKAVASTRSGRIGLIGTAATIRSGKYQQLIQSLLPAAEVFGKACPLFVPLVEAGRIERGDIVIETVAREYLEPLLESGIDALILGCTHYPLLTDVISEIAGPDVTLVDSGAEAAGALALALKERALLSGRETAGRQRYIVSDRPEGFAATAALFLGGDMRGDVEYGSADQL